MRKVKKTTTTVRAVLLAVAFCLAAAVTFPGAGEVVASSARAPDCSDGYPRLGCKIWKVTIEGEIGISPKVIITCETNDKWQCTRDLKDVF